MYLAWRHREAHTGAGCRVRLQGGVAGRGCSVGRQVVQLAFLSTTGLNPNPNPDPRPHPDPDPHPHPHPNPNPDLTLTLTL